MLIEQSNYDIDAGRIKITVSIGATIADIIDTVETLLKRADRLLYQSKVSGRNHVSLKLADEIQSDLD